MYLFQPKLRDMAAVPASGPTSLGLTPSLGSSSESINVEDLSPGQLGSQAQLLAGTAAPNVKVPARQVRAVEMNLNPIACFHVLQHHYYLCGYKFSCF
jgi:hypothetical protein